MDNETISNFRTMRNELLTDEILSLKQDRDRLHEKLDRIVVLAEEGREIADECKSACRRIQTIFDDITIQAKHCR